MKPTTLNVFELFEKERRYVVPLFQRPYVWTEDKQWQPLWEDIAAKADHLLENHDNREAIGTHFLGAAVLAEIKSYGMQVAAREVIDGQQRLTTLQIVLTAFRDIVTSAGGDTGLVKVLNRLTLNDCLMEQMHERYKVWPTTADRDVFETVANPDLSPKLDALYPLKRIPYTKRFYERPRLVEAYEFYRVRIQSYLNYVDNGAEPDTDVSRRRMYVLFEAVTKYMQMVVIELEERDDPQIIFETLNARGEPLLPSDLIRNFVFLEATRKKQNVAVLYADLWQHFDEYEGGDANFWKEEERQGRLTRPRIDLFMFHFLVCKTGREFLITHLFQEFRRWWNDHPESVTIQHRLLDIYEYSQVYKGFFQSADTPSRLNQFIARLRRLDTSTVYPILLYLYGGEANIDPSEREAIITELESYLVRRLVCRLSTQNYNRLFLTVLRVIRRADVVHRGLVRENLLELKGDFVRWPDDAEFGRAWLTHPLYEWISQARVRMLLEAIDLQLETGKQERLHIKDSLSIEHIYPQQPFAGAWDPLDPETLKHSLGNLTLVTQALNSAVSNGPFSQKRGEIAKQSKLRLNTYFQDYRDTDIWSATDIVQRGEALFAVARQIWPHPLADHTVPEVSVAAVVDEVARNDIYNDDPIAGEEPAVQGDNGIHREVYEYLQQIAQDEATTTYTEVAHILGITTESQLHRNELSEVLGKISTYEHRNDRPMLSVVVIFTHENGPGTGFFTLARDLGKFTGSSEMDKLTFFAKELKAVHEYWREQS